MQDVVREWFEQALVETVLECTHSAMRGTGIWKISGGHSLRKR